MAKKNQCKGNNGNLSLSPALCWVGGKTRLKNRIVKIIEKNPHSTYIEPFAGGASVFFKKQLVEKNIINDKNSDLMWFYKNLRDANCAKLQHCNLPTNAKEFQKAVGQRKKNVCNFLRVNKRSYGCQMDKPKFSEAIARDPIRGKVGIEIIKKNCSKYQDKLRKTKILKGDYQKVVKKYDSKDSFIFLDPPYVDTYDYGQEKVHPEDVCKLAKNAKGKVLLTYNNHKRVKKACKGLKIRKWDTNYTIQKSQTGKGKKVTELMITNF